MPAQPTTQVVYTNFSGQIVHENRNGTERDYMPDTLGSTIALLDSSSDKTDTWEYWPYGEVESRTGSSATPFSFVGTYGYYNDGTGNIYVRRRYLQPSNGLWMVKDRHWPRQPAYRYAQSNPIGHIDPSGDELLALIALGVVLLFGAVAISGCGDSDVAFRDCPVPKDEGGMESPCLLACRQWGTAEHEVGDCESCCDLMPEYSTDPMYCYNICQKRMPCICPESRITDSRLYVAPVDYVV